MERMNDIYNALYHVYTAELNCIRSVAFFLNNKELIPNDVEKQVVELAESLYDLRNEHFKA